MLNLIKEKRHWFIVGVFVLFVLQYCGGNSAPERVRMIDTEHYTATNGDKVRNCSTPIMSDGTRKHKNPNHDYIVDGAMATDKKTGLTWMRCSIGQTYSNGKCLNDAKEVRTTNLKKVIAQVNAGKNPALGDPKGLRWRLPFRNELMTLLGSECTDYPLINTEIFPNHVGKSGHAVYHAWPTGMKKERMMFVEPKHAVDFGVTNNGYGGGLQGYIRLVADKR